MRGRSTFLFLLILLIAALLLVSCKPRLNAAPEAGADPASALTANAVDVKTLAAGLQQAQNQQVGTSASAGTEIGQTANQNKQTSQPSGTPQIILTQLPTQRLPTTYTYKITPAKTGTTLTPVVTLTPTATSGAEAGWAGTWTAYLQQPNGTYLTGPLTVTIVGNNLQGTAAFNDVNMTFTGVLSGDSSIATGSYTLDLHSGVFTWQPVSGQFFEGMLDDTLAFCASKPGDNNPEPCDYIIVR